MQKELILTENLIFFNYSLQNGNSNKYFCEWNSVFPNFTLYNKNGLSALVYFFEYWLLTFLTFFYSTLFIFLSYFFSLIYTASLLNLASSKRIKDPSPSKSIRHASICRWKLVSAKRCGKSKPLCQMDIQSPVKHLRWSFLSFINYLYEKLPLRLMTGF